VQAAPKLGIRHHTLLKELRGPYANVSIYYSTFLFNLSIPHRRLCLLSWVV
jgi:hypothetical protein